MGVHFPKSLPAKVFFSTVLTDVFSSTWELCSSHFPKQICCSPLWCTKKFNKYEAVTQSYGLVLVLRSIAAWNRRSTFSESWKKQPVLLILLSLHIDLSYLAPCNLLFSKFAGRHFVGNALYTDNLIFKTCMCMYLAKIQLHTHWGWGQSFYKAVFKHTALPRRMVRFWFGVFFFSKILCFICK